MPRTAATAVRLDGPPPAPIDRMLLTVEEAAAALGVGRSLMFELIAAGRVETVRVGRLRRVRPNDLLAYVETLTS